MKLVTRNALSTGLGFRYAHLAMRLSMVDAAVAIKHLLLSAVLAIAVLMVPQSAVAQAYQCQAPARISVPVIRADAPRRTMAATGYTLAASWSPEFCRTRARSRIDMRQCSGRSGRFGMILHGLWPDGSGGRWPQWCANPRRPSPSLLAAQMCRSPSARLAARQWRKHGTCMTRRPETYFRVSGILWNSLRWPDLDRLSREDDLTAGMLRERFIDANPAFRKEAIGVKRNPRGWLEEIRICYGLNFRPVPCSGSRYGARDGDELKIWRGL